MGEASTDYLYRSTVAAQRMARHIPGARLIAVLRDPVARAWSNWAYHVRAGREDLAFRDALRAEEDRRTAGWAWWWHYRRRGFYGRQIEPFLDAFPQDRLLLLDYGQLDRRPQEVLDRVARFLGISPHPFPLAHRTFNPSRTPRSPWSAALRRMLLGRGLTAALPGAARELLRRGFDALTTRRTSVDPSVRTDLGAGYHDDLRRLQTLTGFDVSGWIR